MKVTNIYIYTHMDIPDVADVAAEHIMEYDPVRVYVDTIGLGAGVYDLLKRRFPAIMYPVDVARRASTTPKSHGRSDKMKFGRLRDELYWRLRLAFTEGTLSIPKDKDLIAELQSIREEDTEDGRLKIESKVKMKRKGGRSPNIADALMITMMGTVQALRARKEDKRNIKRRQNTDSFLNSELSWLYA